MKGLAEKKWMKLFIVVEVYTAKKVIWRDLSRNGIRRKRYQGMKVGVLEAL